MTTIRRSSKQTKAFKISLYVSPLIIVWNVYRIYTDLQIVDAPRWAREGALVGDVMWIAVGVALFVTARKNLKLPIAEYDETSLRLNFGPLAKAEKEPIPLSAITRIQASEPGTVELYYKRAGKDETTVTLSGETEDVTRFTEFARPKKS